MEYLYDYLDYAEDDAYDDDELSNYFSTLGVEDESLSGTNLELAKSQ